MIRMVAEAAEHLGGLDLYVNNAAVALHEPLTRVTLASLGEDDGDQRRGFRLSAAARRPAASSPEGRGAIVAVGSTATVSAQPRETAYRASKAALKAHIEVAAVELAPFGIRVNLVTPGATDTPFVAGADPGQRARALANVPLRREAQPEEIAPAVVFLLSDRLAGYITGAELVVDGGLRLRPIFGGDDAALRALNL